MTKITIEVPDEVKKEIPKDKARLTRIFLMGLEREKAQKALQKFKKLKGCLKEAYPGVTSVELQHRAKEMW
jgi:hypothetical protein